MYLSLSSSLWTQDGYPDDSCSNIRNMFTDSAKSPPTLLSFSKHVTLYSQISNVSTRPLPISTVLRISSTTHVRTIHRSASVCTIALIHWFVTNRTQENISFELLLYGRTGWYFPGRQNLTFHNTLRIQTVGGTACTHVHFRWPDGNLAYLQM